jgi:hypothetical protein
MAVITEDRFDPIKAYCNVRLQQGVPLVDADVNELDDIRKFEVRAFLKWFVGDGVPEGNDGFRIDAIVTPAADNFTIAAGVPAAPAGAGNIDKALRHVGRCIVDGLDVMIEASIDFNKQPLHPTRPDAAALAAKLNVPPISVTELEANSDMTLLVYLDVWEHLVTPADEPDLIVRPLGTESCARLKRAWVVRVKEGTSVPAPSNGHSYYGLAIIHRRKGSGGPEPIVQGDITDLREKRLLIPPSTLITDVLGGTVSDYRRGLNRPAVSLRDAINSLARGEVPGTPEAPIFGASSVSGRRPHLVRDKSNGLVVAWEYSPNDDDPDNLPLILCGRADLDNPRAGFSSPGPLHLNPGRKGRWPHATVLPNGDLLVAYNGASGAVFLRGESPEALAKAEEEPVWSGGGSSYCLPVVAGNHVVFFLRTDGLWRYRRYQHVNKVWDDGNLIEIPGSTGPQSISPKLHAATDASGKVWVAYDTHTSIGVFQMDPTSTPPTISHVESFESSAETKTYASPFVLVAGTKVLVFWHSQFNDLGFSYAEFGENRWDFRGEVPGTPKGAQYPIAALDGDGRIILLFESRDSAYMMYATTDRYRPSTWRPPSFVSPGVHNERTVQFVPGSGLWLVWSRSGIDIRFKQICSPL